MKYKLLSPVTFAGRTVDELDLREKVTGRDLVDMQFKTIGPDATFGDIAKLAARLAGQVDGFGLELEFADIAALSGVIVGFLARGPTTGVKP